MKKTSYALIAVLFLSVVSCGVLKNGSGSSLYSKHNREKVKIKDGLFSSPSASFGDFATSSIDDGVSSRIISFHTQNNPFHFTLSEDEKAKVNVQALYTDRKSLKDKPLPSSFSDADISKIFYAWISSSTANNLNNWELILKNPSYEDLSKNAIVGILRSSDASIDIHAHNRSGNTQSYGELCYEFQLKGIPVAAVQVNGKRKYVWMQSVLNEDVKYAITGAMAALLLK